MIMIENPEFDLEEHTNRLGFVTWIGGMALLHFQVAKATGMGAVKFLKLEPRQEARRRGRSREQR